MTARERNTFTLAAARKCLGVIRTLLRDEEAADCLREFTAAIASELEHALAEHERMEARLHPVPEQR